jgi:hypothetical protein
MLKINEDSSATMPVCWEVWEHKVTGAKRITYPVICESSSSAKRTRTRKETEYKKMLADVESGNIDPNYTYDDKSYRRAHDYRYIEDWMQHNVTFHAGNLNGTLSE